MDQPIYFGGSVSARRTYAIILAMKLHERVLEGELMDAPDLAANLHHSALQGLQRVNRLSGTASILANQIVKLFGSGTNNLRILDLACGGGDVTIGLARQLQRAGISASIEGWDRSDTAIEFARARLSKLSANEQSAATVAFRQCDVSQLDADGQYDVVMCTLFLHHLNRTEALDLLARMYRATRQVVLIDDLRRTWIGYRLAQLGCYLLTRSNIVHVDGPLSVRAAFTEPEVQELCREAGLPKPVITRHWPQRFLACWQRTAVTA